MELCVVVVDSWVVLAELLTNAGQPYLTVRFDDQNQEFVFTLKEDLESDELPLERSVTIEELPKLMAIFNVVCRPMP